VARDYYILLDVPAGFNTEDMTRPTTTCADVTAAVWERGVIPDFRTPDGLRIGLSPLSTGFAELAHGLSTLEQVLTELANG